MAWMSKDKPQESGRGLELEFFHDVFPVGLDGVNTKVKVVRYLLIGKLPADEVQDLFFTSCEVKLLQEGVVCLKVLHG